MKPLAFTALKVRLGFSLVALGLTIGGCAESAPFGKAGPKTALVKPQKSAWDNAQAANAKPEGDDADGDKAGDKAGVTTPSLHISDAIARECGITNVSTASSFEFDSTTLSDDDRGVLTEVAKCMTVGALRGKKVALVGRADNRGEDEYNMSLGSARATSVYEYLHDLGVSPTQVKASSRGEIDATGSDETGWAQDRRVDIEEL
ncbi:MAG TPA: OmpA family protein [Polyangiaceae bacterium]